HGNMSRGYIQYELGYEERIEPRRAVSCIKAFHFFNEGDHTADTGTPDHAHAILINAFAFQSSLFYSLVCTDNRYLRKPVKLAGFFPFKIIFRIEVLELAGKLGFEFCYVKLLNEISARNAINQPFPVFLGGIAYGCQGADTGNDNAFVR